MRRSTALALVVLLGAAGCSGSDDDAAPSTAPTTAEPGTTAPTGSGTTVDVRAVSGNRWSPSTLQLKVGDTLVVTNSDPDVPHNFVAAGVGRSDTLQPDDTFRLTFPKAGTFDFVCTFHPGMEGEVTVA